MQGLVTSSFVQRQHCGAVGKLENCVVSVHLGYATPDFYTLVDGELYLPEETWHEDRQRCREAGIGEDIVYRPKWQMALEQYHRAVGNGLRFAWLTFDEGYGRNGPFLRETKLGMDHFEVRKFRSIQRHLILSCLSHVFLSEFSLRYRGGKSRPDAMPGPHRSSEALSDLVSRRALFPETGRIDRCAIGLNATPKQQGRSQPSTAYNQAIACDRHKTEEHKQMSLELLVAL